MRPSFSYKTTAYVLYASGARKLLRSGFLSHLLPLDDFLPALYGASRGRTWKRSSRARRGSSRARGAAAGVLGAARTQRHGGERGGRGTNLRIPASMPVDPPSLAPSPRGRRTRPAGASNAPLRGNE